MNHWLAWSYMNREKKLAEMSHYPSWFSNESLISNQKHIYEYLNVLRTYMDDPSIENQLKYQKYKLNLSWNNYYAMLFLISGPYSVKIKKSEKIFRRNYL